MIAYGDTRYARELCGVIEVKSEDQFEAILAVMLEDTPSPRLGQEQT